MDFNKKQFVLKNRDLLPFKKLQTVPFELGGIIEINKNGLVRFVSVPGKKTSIESSKIPIGVVQYHTHPSIPNGSLSDALKLFKKTKDFPIDTVVQSVSDDDLFSMTLSLMHNTSKMMVIITPEGIYTLTENGKFIPQENINELRTKTRRFLKKRDKLIIEELEENLLPKLKKENEEEKIKLLKNFQIKVGNIVKKLIEEEYPLIKVDFFPWKSRQISLTI